MTGEEWMKAYMRTMVEEWSRENYAKGREEGIGVGREEGICIGREEGRKELILHALSMGHKPEEVARLPCLPLDDVLSVGGGQGDGDNNG